MSSLLASTFVRLVLAPSEAETVAFSLRCMCVGDRGVSSFTSSCCSCFFLFFCVFLPLYDVYMDMAVWANGVHATGQCRDVWGDDFVTATLCAVALLVRLDQNRLNPKYMKGNTSLDGPAIHLLLTDPTKVSWRPTRPTHHAHGGSRLLQHDIADHDGSVSHRV